MSFDPAPWLWTQASRVTGARYNGALQALATAIGAGAATVQVGTVTGLPANAAPTVSNSGTASAAVLNFGIPANGLPTCDLLVILGQSLAVDRAPRVTEPGNPDLDTLLMPNGGAMPSVATSPAPPTTSYPSAVSNYASLVPYAPLSGVEGYGPGFAYQSKQAGVGKQVVLNCGLGSSSLRFLHTAPLANLKAGLAKVVPLIRALGYEPNIIMAFDQGQADADAVDDGGSGTSPTSTADYLIGAAKLFASMRKAASNALGYDWGGPIWVTPLLTQNGSSSVAARVGVINAQAAIPATIPGTKLLPPWSHAANLFDSDLVHPLGSGYRQRGEMIGAYVRSALTPPRMLSKAVVGSTVEITFDQPIKLSATVPDMAVPLNSKNGFTVINNVGAEVAISAVSITGNKATLTVASTAALTGTWYVRNGCQQNIAVGTVAASASYMPRTLVVGTTNVGTAKDGTVLENFSITQEL